MYSVARNINEVASIAKTFHDKIELVVNLAATNELYNTYSETAFNYQYNNKINTKMIKKNMKIDEKKNENIEEIQKIQKNIATVLFQNDHFQNRRKSLSGGYVITAAKYGNMKISDIWETKIVKKSDFYSDPIYETVFYSSSGSKTNTSSSSGSFAG